MRALIALSAAAVLLAACETAFVGRAPSGRYELVEMNGRALPQVRPERPGCEASVLGGYFNLDSLARRFEMRLRERSSCSAAAVQEERVAGSYTRRDGRLSLEEDDAGVHRRPWFATESGDSILLDYAGARLRFRQAERPRRP